MFMSKTKAGVDYDSLFSLFDWLKFCPLQTCFEYFFDFQAILEILCKILNCLPGGFDWFTIGVLLWD